VHKGEDVAEVGQSLPVGPSERAGGFDAAAGAVRPLREFSPALACSAAIACAYTLIALVCPPSMDSDAGWGFLVWRSLQEGAPLNTYWSPDPANIAVDHAVPLTWFSPGQYLLPGLIASIGLPIGAGIALTCGVALLSLLLGCIMLCRRFALAPSTALLAVLFLSAFRYSTAPFSIYDGGTILLQGALPWLCLLALRVPAASLASSAALAFLVVALGFLAKLTGVIVAAAALTAACAPALLERRTITRGMLGGAVGAGAAAALLYVFWFSQGGTPGTDYQHGSNFEGLLFSFVAPWGAGAAPMDLMAWLFRNPGRVVFADTWPLVLMSMPVAAAMIALLSTQLKSGEARRLFVFAALFYLVYALALGFIFVRGGDVSIEERHVRAPGVLFMLCAFAAISHLQWRHPARLLALAAFGFFALYGVASFVSRTAATLSAGHIHAASRTNQPIVSAAALEFLNSAHAREGRAALFVLPSPDVALALPRDARVLVRTFDFMTVEEIQRRRYRGAVEGAVHIAIQRRNAEGPKGEAARAAFADAPGAWAFRDFGETRVYFQQAPSRAARR
jgi:hypothetical protein